MLKNLGFTDEDEIWELVDDDKVFDVKDISRDAYHIPCHRGGGQLIYGGIQV